MTTVLLLLVAAVGIEWFHRRRQSSVQTVPAPVPAPRRTRVEAGR